MLLLHTCKGENKRGRGKGWKVRMVLDVMAYYSGLDDARDALLFLCALCNIPSPPRFVVDASSLPKTIPLKTQDGRTVVSMTLTSAPPDIWSEQGNGGSVAYYIPSRLDLNYGRGGKDMEVIRDIVKSYSNLAESLGFKKEKAPPQLRTLLTFIAAFNAKVIAEAGSLGERGEKV